MACELGFASTLLSLSSMTLNSDALILDSLEMPVRLPSEGLS